ncbi:RNA polymerase I-specific transcription initiation factor RRN3 [Backusella circina FSU 941]|nr:RNA polymerase I-specific transcription initiation factor RRN3 [Backusella circina FSU 941]
MRLPPCSKTTRTGSYERCHIALQSVLQLIPTGTNSLFVSIVRHMPHRRFNTAEQAAYIKNILYVSEYVPVLRKQILGLVVDQATQIDSHIQIELDETDQDIEFEVYKIDLDGDYDSEESDDESDEDDEETDISDDESFDSVSGYREEKNDSITKIKYMVRKLDTVMFLIFDYFSRCALSAPSEVQSDLFHALVDVFDRTILKTLKSRYTQFLLFYFCSINVTIYSDFYLEHLIQHAIDPLKPTITRVASASYISSYVARAKFIEHSTIQSVIMTLTSWCNAYIEHHEPNLHGLESTKHEVFYAVVQAILYIFCFRWRDLVLESDELVLEEEQEDNCFGEYQDLAPQSGNGSRNWCAGMRNLSHVIMSRFNPLKMCSPSVVQQFAKLARNTHFMYVYPILEKNRDIFVAGLGESNLMQTIQTFFPFDPYKLEASKIYIDNIYFEWIPEDDDDEDESEEELDEDEEDMTTGMMAMSISPSPTHYLH